jgi:hypothetical protein
MRRFAITVWYGGVALLGIGIFLILIGIVSSAYILFFGILSTWLGFWLCQRGGKLWEGNQGNEKTARKLK